MVKSTGRRRIPNDKIINALLIENTVAKSANRAHVSTKLVYDRLHDPQFKAELKKAQRQVVEHSVRKLEQASVRATDTLIQIMTDPSTNDQLKVQCANSILSKAFNAYEMTELVDRLEALESQLKVIDHA